MLDVFIYSTLNELVDKIAARNENYYTTEFDDDGEGCGDETSFAECLDSAYDMAKELFNLYDTDREKFEKLKEDFRKEEEKYND